MSPIFPAATVVLVRDGTSGLEVLLLRRSQKVSFAKGVWVFPGGRIDKVDYRDDLADVESAARRAAVRETLEETRLAIESSSLVYLSHWTTPAHSSMRFATWFFVAPVPPDVDSEAVVVDGGEILEARWCHPGDVWADSRAGLIDVLRPTRASLNTLAGCESVAEALAVCADYGNGKEAPRYDVTAEGVRLTSPRAASSPGEEYISYLLTEPWR